MTLKYENDPFADSIDVDCNLTVYRRDGKIGWSSGFRGHTYETIARTMRDVAQELRMRARRLEDAARIVETEE